MSAIYFGDQASTFWNLCSMQLDFTMEDNWVNMGFSSDGKDLIVYKNGRYLGHLNTKMQLKTPKITVTGQTLNISAFKMWPHAVTAENFRMDITKRIELISELDFALLNSTNSFGTDVESKLELCNGRCKIEAKRVTYSNNSRCPELPNIVWTHRSTLPMAKLDPENCSSTSILIHQVKANFEQKVGEHIQTISLPETITFNDKIMVIRFDVTLESKGNN
jgi:hypothetical protein